MLAGSINGNLLEVEQLTVPLTDLSVLRGVGVFDFLITYQRKPFFLEGHVERLFNSANTVDLEIGVSRDVVCQWVRELIDSQPGKDEFAVRLLALAGRGKDSLTVGDKAEIVVALEPRTYYPTSYFEEGVKVCTVEFQRSFPSAKTTQYMEGVVYLNRARKEGALEILYHSQGLLREGATSNVTIVKDGALRTPEQAVLPGITIKVLSEDLCKDMTFKREEVKLDDLFSADEAFLTASNKEVMPITKVDNQEVGNGKVGPITKEIMSRFRDFTTGY